MGRSKKAYNPYPYGPVPLGFDPDTWDADSREVRLEDLQPSAEATLYVGPGADKSWQYCVCCDKQFPWEGIIPILCDTCRQKAFVKHPDNNFI